MLTPDDESPTDVFFLLVILNTCEKRVPVWVYNNHAKRQAQQNVKEGENQVYALVYAKNLHLFHVPGVGIMHIDCIRTISSALSMWLKLWKRVAWLSSVTGLMLTPK
jgi:hypothetical protein